MQLLRGLKNYRFNDACVATIGNFDGVHLGHQAMLKDVIQSAKQKQLPSCVISFEPLPHEYFAAQQSQSTGESKVIHRLHGLRNRAMSLKQLGIDRFLLLPFNAELAALSADEFIEKVLVKTTGVKHLVVGDDFQFGHNRGGNLETLKAAGGSLGFTVQQQSTISDQNARISSSRIRQLLSEGDLDQSAALLGMPYRISGRVIHGEKMGRQLGFPTANVALKGLIPPLSGVFAVIATVAETQQRFAAVANLGERPTIGGRALLLEVHLLDATENLYSRHLDVDFIQFIRGEQKFESLDALKAQIAADATQASEYLNGHALLRTPANRIH